MKYEIEWMLAVLDDLMEFCGENEMPTSEAAIAQVKTVAEAEATALREKAQTTNEDACRPPENLN